MKILKGKKLHRIGLLKLYKNGWGSVGNRGRGAEASGGGGGSKGGGPSPDTGKSTTEILEANAKKLADENEAKAAAEKKASDKAAAEKAKQEEIARADRALKEKARQQEEEARKDAEAEGTPQRLSGGAMKLDEGEYKPTNYDDAFSHARDTGKREFDWKGKPYTTRLKDESEKDFEAKFDDGKGIGSGPGYQDPNQVEDPSKTDSGELYAAQQEVRRKIQQEDYDAKDIGNSLVKKVIGWGAGLLGGITGGKLLGGIGATAGALAAKKLAEKYMKEWGMDEERAIMSANEAVELAASREEQGSSGPPRPSGGNQGDRPNMVHKPGGQVSGQGPGFSRPTGTVPPKPLADVQEGLKGDRRERLLDRLESIATGKEGLAKKQMKAMQEQSLKQRLSQMQSMRGAPTAAKMRMFDRASDESRRELAEKGPMLSLKERKEADYLMSQMLENQENRDLNMELQKMSLAEKEAMRNMSKAEAQAQGKGALWLSVAKESWKLFGPDVKKWYSTTDFFGEDTSASFDDTDLMDTVFNPQGASGGSWKAGDIDLGDQVGDDDDDPWWKFWSEGGKVDGPGNETSDSIPARLSDGEFVIKASAVRGLGKSLGGTDDQDDRKKGVDFLYKLQDKMDKKAKGGEVDEKRFISSMSPELRRKIADYEMDKIASKRIKEAREKSGNEGFQAARVRPKEVESIEKKYGVWDEYAEGGEAKPDFDRFLEFMDKGTDWSLSKQNIQRSHLPEEKKRKLLEKLGDDPKFSEGGEAYVRPKRAFREAIGYEPESRFHDKAEKDAKFGGARRKFRHFQDGGPVDFEVKPQFKVEQPSGYGSVIAAQGDLNRRLEELERRMGR